MARKVDVYLEEGSKRTFAGAIEWPGWCRSGRDEASALEALFEYGPRFAKVVARSRLGFEVPADPGALTVVERVKGNATTDFGAPDVSPSIDAEPIRDVAKILEHVLGAEESYLRMIGGKLDEDERGDPDTERKAMLRVLETASRGCPAVPTRRQAVDAALLRAPCGLARARSRVGAGGTP